MGLGTYNHWQKGISKKMNLIILNSNLDLNIIYCVNLLHFIGKLWVTYLLEHIFLFEI